MSTYTATDPEGETIRWSLPKTAFETDRGDFSISNSGVLSFNRTPNYESPPASNVYKITVRASDGSLSDSRNVTVTVTNEPPTINSGPSSPSYAEGGTGPVGTYTASDPGGGSITWSLPNTSFETDRSDFSISSSGELSFDSFPDYERPHDSDQNNVYKVTVRASDGSLSASGNVTVTVTNVDEAPQFPGTESGVREIPENTPAGRNIGAAVAARDVDGLPLTYTLGGTDLRHPSPSSPPRGNCGPRAGLDHETKSSYSVTVTAEDTTNLAVSQDVTVTVTDVKECPEAPARAPGGCSVHDRLRVTWNEPANTGPPVTGYSVQYKAATAPTFSVVNTPDLELTLVGLKEGTE